MNGMYPLISVLVLLIDIFSMILCTDTEVNVETEHTIHDFLSALASMDTKFLETVSRNLQRPYPSFTNRRFVDETTAAVEDTDNKIPLNISSECYTDLDLMMTALENSELWALSSMDKIEML